MNRLRREQGFSMIVVMVAMLIGSLLALAALSAANGDFPSARENQDRKAAYAAAESGLAYFNFKLNQSNVYWKTCGDNNSGRVPETGSNAVPGTTSQNYVIEFLPANSATKCDSASPDATMIDRATATFRIRITGRSGGVYRSIIATYKRKSFLDYLWFTTSEAGDPAIFSGTTTECLKARSQRSGCTEIQFISNDSLKGPMHTDDTFLVCNNPLFGRDPSQYTFPVNDAIEAGGPAPGYVQSGGCSGQPRVYGTFTTGVASMPMPTTNSGLATVATANGWTFTGRIRIRLNGASMDVWQQNSSGTDSPSTPIKSGWPTNGVIYVNSGTCSSNPSPVDTDYNESAGCANAYVSGSYSRDLTIASANDIIVGPNTTSDDGNIYNTGNAALGLIANRYVRVWHPVTGPNFSGCYTNDSPAQTNVEIDAAIMSVQHSFIVDNYDKGQQLGNLTVNGAIAQKFRGTVGSTGGCGGGHGYFKDYNYDDRFHYLNPPSFLDPVTESWSVKRRNEQVPAAKPTGL